MSIDRRQLLVGAGKLGALALLAPSTAFASSDGLSLEDHAEAVLNSVAPLTEFRFTQLQTGQYSIYGSWGPGSELIGQVDPADENTITVMSLILPENMRGQGVPEQLYRAWGGRARAAFPTAATAYDFLDAPPSTTSSTADPGASSTTFSTPDPGTSNTTSPTPDPGTSNTTSPTPEPGASGASPPGG